MVTEKYAVGEYERRFLLDEIPAGVTNPRTIVDLYLDDTRLRLRTVAQPGVDIDRKLGHKRRVDEGDPMAIMHTSLYLDEREYAVLATIPGRRLVKTRWTVDVDGTPCSVNVFSEALSGLIILEADLGDGALLAGFAPPPWAGPEITFDETFTGGELAGKSLADLAAALSAAQGGSSGQLR